MNDDFAKWLEQTNLKQEKVKINRGKVHEYLGMKLDFSVKGKLKVDMCDYVKEMLESILITLGKNDVALTPEPEDWFGQKGTTAQKLDKEEAEAFITTAQGMF